MHGARLVSYLHLESGQDRGSRIEARAYNLGIRVGKKVYVFTSFIHLDFGDEFV